MVHQDAQRSRSHEQTKVLSRGHVTRARLSTHRCVLGGLGFRLGIRGLRFREVNPKPLPASAEGMSRKADKDPRTGVYIVHVNVAAYTSVYACVCVCIYIYIYIYM